MSKPLEKIIDIDSAIDLMAIISADETNGLEVTEKFKTDISKALLKNIKFTIRKYRCPDHRVHAKLNATLFDGTNIESVLDTCCDKHRGFLKNKLRL